MKNIFIATILLVVFQLSGQVNSRQLTRNGAWCWFSDPRAIWVDDIIYTGWVKTNGTVEASTLDLTTGKVNHSDLYFNLKEMIIVILLIQ